MNLRLHSTPTSIGLVAVFCCLLTLTFPTRSSFADELRRLAILPVELEFEHWQHSDRANGLIELLQAELEKRSPHWEWVERREIDAVLQEQWRHLASGRGSNLAVGRLLGADLLIRPSLQWDSDQWTLQLSIVDPQRADELSSIHRNVDGDPKQGPSHFNVAELAQELDGHLVMSVKRLALTADWITVGVLFCGNLTESNSRLDDYGPQLLDAVAQKSVEGVRTVRFPAVGVARGEQELSLARLLNAEDSWNDLADLWVWGEYRETDWEGRAFEDATIEVTLFVWNGQGEPTRIVERGKVGQRAELANLIANMVAETVQTPVDRTESATSDRMVHQLMARALDLQERNLEGNNAVNDVWLNRWRQTYRLFDLARFIDPENKQPSFEYLLSRYRIDMTIATGPASGVQYLDVPSNLWYLQRAVAWGQYGDRFGFGDRWPRSWPRRLHLTDNRIRWRRGDLAYILTAFEVLRRLPSSSSSRRHNWPLADEQVGDLATYWSDEFVRRVDMVTNEIHQDDLEEVIGSIFGNLRSLHAYPNVCKKVVDLLLAQASEELKESVLAKQEEEIRRIAKRIGDEAWAAALVGTSPEKQRMSVVRTLPSKPPTQPMTQPEPWAGLSFGRRYRGSTVRAIAAWNGAWIAASHGQDLGLSGFPGTNFLFMHVPKDGEKNRRIEQSLGLTAGVTSMVRDGPRVWMASYGNGIAWIRLDTTDWKRFKLASGLPVEQFIDLDLNPTGAVVAVSGQDTFPPVVAYVEKGKWTGQKVDTFPSRELEGGLEQRPYGKRVAASASAFVVLGDFHGICPFISLWLRDSKQWVDLRTSLLTHLDEIGLDIHSGRFGGDRFNAADVVALPVGGFGLVHPLGISRIDDRGHFIATEQWPENVNRRDLICQAIVSDDGREIYCTTGVRNERDTYDLEVFAIPLEEAQAGSRITLPYQTSSESTIAQDGDRLLISTKQADPPIIFLPVEKFGQEAN